jgi:hypothetical protein
MCSQITMLKSKTVLILFVGNEYVQALRKIAVETGLRVDLAHLEHRCMDTLNADSLIERFLSAGITPRSFTLVIANFYSCASAAASRYAGSPCRSIINSYSSNSRRLCSCMMQFATSATWPSPSWTSVQTVHIVLWNSVTILCKIHMQATRGS